MNIVRDPRAVIVVVGMVFILLAHSLTAPRDFPAGSIITVAEGAGLQKISKELEGAHLIRSTFWFRTFAIALGGERGMKAGQYYFSHPVSAPAIAWRIVFGDNKIETIKITVPEGFTNSKISKLFDKRFGFFENNLFEATAPQGYLFPDTYFIPITATASTTIKMMRDNFTKQVEPLLPLISGSGKTLDQIVKMASLLEAEAKTQEDRELISDILWKRLKLGMPLQVDSEMGTYEFQGLPKTPINNPGLISLKAALHEEATQYLYFLTGKDGKMHYSKTFDEHKQNIAKYLR